MKNKTSINFSNIDEKKSIPNENNHLVNNKKSAITKKDLILKIKNKEKNIEKILSNFDDFLHNFSILDNLPYIDYDTVSPWDIVEIIFSNQNNKDINLKITIFKNKAKKVIWFIKITDLEKNITTQTKIWTIMMPIAQFWKREIELSLKWAFYVLMKDALQERNIKKITLFKRIKQKEEKISNNDLKDKNRIIDFFRKNIIRLIKK